jgi:hypothetical protein
MAASSPGRSGPITRPGSTRVVQGAARPTHVATSRGGSGVPRGGRSPTAGARPPQSIEPLFRMATGRATTCPGAAWTSAGSTGVYALSVAGVSILQFEHDRQLIAAREPVADAIAELATHHDRLTQRIEAVRGAYERAADRYGLVSDELRRLHDRLADLHGQVAAIEGAAGRLPTAISLPTVPQVKPAPAPVAAPAPKSHAKTGASGGG